MRYLYEIYARTDDSFDPSDETITALRPHQCAACREWPMSSDPLPDVVVDGEPPPSAVSFVSSLLFGVVSDEFSNALGFEHVERNLRTGRLIRADGSPIPNYRTFLGRPPLVLRGGPRSRHVVCGRCGALHYIPVPVNNPYVTAASVPGAEQLYAGMVPRLIVNEATRQRLGGHWDSAVKIYRLPVREHPEDGLPDELGLFPTPAQLKAYKPNPPPYHNPVV